MSAPDVTFKLEMPKSVLAAGILPWTPLGKLRVLPRPSNSINGASNPGMDSDTCGVEIPPPLENSGYRSVCITTARDVLHFSFQNTTEAAVLSIMLQTELYGGNKFYYIA